MVKERGRGSGAQYEIVSSRVAYESGPFRVREDLCRIEVPRGAPAGVPESSESPGFFEHDGNILEKPFFLVQTVDWINVVALTPEREVVLVRQYRHGTDSMCLEIPGGMVDPGETPLQAAIRELEEETGYRAESWTLLGTVRPNPAFMDNRCFTFLATPAMPAGPPHPEEWESIEVSTVPLTSIPGLIGSGEIDHTLVISAFHLFELFSRDQGPT